MGKSIIQNKYKLFNDYAIGYCKNGIEFYIDIEDYEKVKPYNWRTHGNAIETNINRKCVQLSRFILGVTDKNTKVLLQHPFDYRKKNLFYRNKYILFKDYYEGECFDGTKFKIDVNDFEKVKKYTWHLANGYIVGKVNKKEIKLHRFLMGIKEGYEVDHINRDPYDNRRINLRIVNRSKNMQNTGISKNNTTGYKGVYKMHDYDKNCAQININGKRIYLGSYDTINEAYIARKNAEEKYKYNNI